MFCKHCHYEFYVPGDTLGAKVRCPNCTVTLQVENRQLICPCPECGEMLDVALWMIGSASNCPHCQKEIILSLGEDFIKYFPDSPKQTAMLQTASRKAGEIIGKYRVIRCLGIGGMGEVYLVEHTLLNTRCALKLLKKDVAKDDPEMRARLLREARLASQIQHPNLIAVLDAELEENSSDCYIVMEYVDGVSIESILADGPMLEARALEIITQVAEALKTAAAHHIIHRDIKPANIMLSSTGEVKVADLGIAKVESDSKHNMTLTMDNAVLGTPHYASPEQLRSSHQVDCRADIYSLGVTLFHMLTGKRPFESESVFGVMANVLEKDLPMAHEVNPAISMKTSILISRMTEKKRDERPENFDVLLKELKSGKKKERGSKLKKAKKNSSGSNFGIKKLWQLFLVVLSLVCLLISGIVIHSKMFVEGDEDMESYDPDFAVRKDDMILDKSLTRLLKVSKKLSRAVIPDSVQVISSYAFKDMANLEEVVLPQWLNKIESLAFVNCRKLEKLTIPATVSQIDIMAFSGVKKIELAPGNHKFRLTRDGGLVSLHNQTLLYVPPHVRSFTIPDYVTRISESAFKGCRQLTSIEIPGSVTTIRSEAFMDCENLTEVNIKAVISTIPSDAFHNCVKLKKIILPDTIRMIGRSAFENCSSLESLNLPDGVMHINFNAFKGCPGLSGMKLPPHLPKYYKRSDYGLGEEKKTATVPVTEIPSNKTVSAPETSSSSTVSPAAAAESSSSADYRLSDDGKTLLEWINKNVARVVVPAGVKKIADNVFSSNKTVRSVRLPDGLEEIGKYAFNNCENLSEINIPDTVTVVRSFAFEGCVNLDLELPASVNSLGSRAILKVKSVKLAPGNHRYEMDRFGAIFWHGPVRSIRSIRYIPKIREYKIPYGVRSLPHSLCAGNTALQSIEIPNSVMTIGESVFSGCSSLTEITIPASVNKIKNNVFTGCSNLRSITIPAHLSSSSSNWGLPSSCRIKIVEQKSYPSAVSAAQTAAQASGNAKDFQLSGDGKILERCLNYQIRNAVIPQGVTEIQRSAFSNCRNLESVVIPEGVTKIGDNAFYYCYRLKKVTLPESLTEIGEKAFGRCSQLDITISQNVQIIGSGALGHVRGVSVDRRNRYFKINNGVLFNRAGTILYYVSANMNNYMVPAGVTVIDSYAFVRCRNLSRVVLPEGLKIIGSYAFNSCRSLKSVTLPDSLTEVGMYAFSGCRNLKLTIPLQVRTIGNGAFNNISSLKLSPGNRNFKLDSYGAIVKADNTQIVNVPQHLRHYEIPNGVKMIPGAMFSNMKNLTSVKIPDSVRRIEYSAFSNCENLELTIPKNVIYIDSDALRGVKSVKLEANSEYFKYDPQGILFNNRYGEVIYVDPEVTEIKMPAGVKRVGYGVFRNCRKLERLYLPKDMMSRKQYMGIPGNVDVRPLR